MKVGRFCRFFRRGIKIGKNANQKMKISLKKAVFALGFNKRSARTRLCSFELLPIKNQSDIKEI